jgi:hypothetical protein
LAVGGDVQTRATDVIRVRLTEKQLKALGAACNKFLEVPSTGDCPETIDDLARRIVHLDFPPCRPFDPCGELRVFADPDQKTLGSWGYFEVSDNRPEESLCSSEPNHLCIRVGIKTPEQLGEIAKTKLSPAPTSSPPPTTDSSPTPTADPSQQPTSNPGTTATPSEGESSADPSPGSSTLPASPAEGP